MTIETGVCWSFKLEQAGAIHDFTSDTFRIALYAAAANMSPATTTAYTTNNEVVGGGYAPGGLPISVKTGYPKINTGGQCEIRFDGVTWSLTTIVATGALIYNASKANRAVALLDFATLRSTTNGPFSIEFPDAAPALIVIS